MAKAQPGRKKGSTASKKKKLSKSVNSNSDESTAEVTAHFRPSVSQFGRPATLEPPDIASSDKIKGSDDASRLSQIIQQQLEVETLFSEPETSEGHDIRSGSPQILNSENLEKHKKTRAQIEGDHGWKPQSPTVNDRLRQAKNFLSDEDVNRHLKFASRHEKIDKFLQHLANEKVECDILLYNEVQAMVQVHRSRMNRQETPNNGRPNGDLGPLQSDRLSLVDTSQRGLLRGAPLRDDHPPFTLERPADQNLFLKALHGPSLSNDPGVKDRGLELLTMERDGFSETINNPALVHEWVEERESQTRDARFNARATKRGRRRAAIRLALRSFATNCEQHHTGRWERSDLRVPSAPVSKIPERGIASAGKKDAQKSHETSFPWTLKYSHFRQLQQDKPKVRNDRSLQDFAQPLNGNQPIATEKQALDLLRAEMLKEHHENRQRLEVTNDESWASPIPEPGKTKRYFSLDRRSGAAPQPNKVARPMEEDHQQVSQAPPENRASVGSGEIQEDSRSHADGLGTGAVVSEEIQQVDPRQEHLLQVARDPKETFFPGAPAFMFAETPFLRAMTSKQIEHDLGLGQGRNSRPNNTVYLPSAQFALPEPASTQPAAPFDPGSGHTWYLRRNPPRPRELEPDKAGREHHSKSKISKPSKVQGRTTPSKKPRVKTDSTDFSRKIFGGWTFDRETGTLTPPKPKSSLGQDDAEVVEVMTGGVGSRSRRGAR